MAERPPLDFSGGRAPAQQRNVPRLADLALDALADNSADIHSLVGIAEELTIALLGKVMQRGRLDFRLACVFRDAGHRELSEAMQSLDLFSAVPSHNAIGHRGGGCR